MKTSERAPWHAEVEQVLVALHRVCRTGAIHRPNNEAVRQTIEQSFAAFAPWFGTGGERLSLLFVDDTLYVNGGLLRLSPEHLEAASAIGETLDHIGCNEVSVYPGITPGDLNRLAAAVHAGDASTASSPTLQLRRIDPELLTLLRRTSASARERLQQGYVSALVVLRVLDTVALADEPVAAGSLRGIVRQIVAVADEDPAAFHSLVTAPPTHHDRPGQCVRAAILTIECCRLLGVEWHLQVQLALNALLHDIARIRAARLGRDPGDRQLPALPQLNDQQQEHLMDAMAATALLTDRPGPDAAERAAIAYLGHRDDVPADADSSAAWLLAQVPVVCREFAELGAYDVFSQSALEPAEAIAVLREQHAGARSAQLVELLANVVGDARALAPGAPSVLETGASPSASVVSAAAPHAQAGDLGYDAGTSTLQGLGLSTKRTTQPGTVSHAAGRGGDPPAADERTPQAGVPLQPPPTARPGDTDFSAVVRHYFGDDQAPLTAPGEPAGPAVVTREFRTGDLDEAAHEAAAAPAPESGSAVAPAPHEAPAAPAHSDESRPFGRTEPTIPTSALAIARETHSDGSTGRFRLSVDPHTGTLQAEDSHLNLGGEASVPGAPGIKTTLPGLPAGALAQPGGFDPAEAFIRERHTPAVHLRHATQGADSQLGVESGRPPRDSDEYDVHEADRLQVQDVEVQSAHLISRAKTPPRPMPAVGTAAPTAPPRPETPTLEVSAGESARILGAFARGRGALPPSELRRALAVAAAEPEVDASQPPPSADRHPTPAAAPEAPPTGAAVADGRTRNLGDALDDARRLAESSMLPTGAPGSTLDMTAPAEAALASAALLAVQKAEELRQTRSGSTPEAGAPATQPASPPTNLPATEPVEAAASGRLRPSARRVVRPAEPKEGADISQLGPVLAKAEEWSITQTLDVGAIQAKRYLEAFARNQRRKPGPETQAPAAPASGTSATPTETRATRPESPTPMASPAVAPEATPGEAPAETLYDADGNPITWRRSRETVKRLREQRHSGSLPVVARPRRGYFDSNQTVDDLLRKYLDDK